jgi:hypothetical protein
MLSLDTRVYALTQAPGRFEQPFTPPDAGQYGLEAYGFRPLPGCIRRAHHCWHHECQCIDTRHSTNLPAYCHVWGWWQISHSAQGKHRPFSPNHLPHSACRNAPHLTRANTDPFPLPQVICMLLYAFLATRYSPNVKWLQHAGSAWRQLLPTAELHDLVPFRWAASSLPAPL